MTQEQFQAKFYPVEDLEDLHAKNEPYVSAFIMQNFSKMKLHASESLKTL